MSELQTSTHVTFSIVGELFEPDEITKLLNITPNKSYRTGDPIKRTTPVQQFYNHTNWSIRSIIEPENDLQKHIQSILQRLQVHEPVIQALSKKHRVEFYCSIFADSNKPQIILHPDILSSISRLGASIIISTYCSG